MGLPWKSQKVTAPQASGSSDEDQGHMAGLAASMWSALQKQRQGPTSRESENIHQLISSLLKSFTVSFGMCNMNLCLLLGRIGCSRIP